MKHSQQFALRGVIILTLAGAVVACGPSASRSPPPGGGGVVTLKQEDQFGVPFGIAFRADNNSEPYSPADGDIAAISLTTEPIDIK